MTERTKASNGHYMRSATEEVVEQYLSCEGFTVAYEPVTIHHKGRSYTPDFLVASASVSHVVVEVKPTLGVAAAELRWDMLVTGSPLWLLADVFMVFTPARSVATNDGVHWHEARLIAEALETGDRVGFGRVWDRDFA